MRRTLFQIALAALLLVILSPCAVRGQSQPPQTPPPTPQDQPPKAQDQKQSAAKSTVPPQTSASTTTDPAPYDPFHAEQDVEVGTFYMHKGDLDAAIPRFEHAISVRANFAKPRLLLAECYEKKHEPATALKYYKEYLKIYPDAPDRKAVEKKIDKLSSR
jgi:tetratricopeptide (TPR) repeat protein